MKHLLTKIISFILILVGLYNLFLSIIAIFFIYPETFPAGKYVAPRVQESLVEKAIIIYLSTVIDGFFGTLLFLKPKKEIKTIHFVLGLILLVFSLFFVTQTELTKDPVVDIILDLIKN